MLRAAQEVTRNSGLMRSGDIKETLPVANLENQADAVKAIGILEFALAILIIFGGIPALPSRTHRNSPKR